MEESGRESLDGSSIKPVSSLRSHFEQMSNSKPNVGASTPRQASPKVNSAINGINGKSSNHLASGLGRLEIQKIEIKNSFPTKFTGDINQESSGQTVCNEEDDQSTSPKFSLQRPPSRQPSVIKSLHPQSSPTNKLVGLKMPSGPPNDSEIPSPGIPSRILRTSARQHVSSNESIRPRIMSTKPPSPPPPRRSSEHRRILINRAEKPKISHKPVSLVLGPGTNSLETGSAGLVDEKISPFITPPSSGDPTVEFSHSNLLRVQSTGFLESNYGPNKSSDCNSQYLSIYSRGECNIGKGLTRDEISPQITGDQRPILPARPSVQLDSSKFRPTQLLPTRSKSVANSSAASSATFAHTRGLSIPSQQHTTRERERSMTIDQNSDKVAVNLGSMTKEPLKPCPDQFPDPSHSNRRPPYLKKGVRDISTKYETRIMDVCGEYVCTSGHITRVWNLLDGEIIASFAYMEGIKVTSVAFKPATYLNDEGLKLWLGNNVGDIQEIDILSQSITGTKVNAHGRREIIKIYRHYHDMWTLDSSGTLNLWAADDEGSLALKNHVQTFRLPKGHTFSMVIGNELWFATGKDLRVFLPTIDSTSQFQVFQSPLTQPNTGDITAGTAIKTEPERLFFGHADGKVSIYSKKNYACLSVVNISVYKITAMAAIAGNLWAGFSTGMVYVYDVEKSPWVVRKDWSAHQGPVIKLVSDPSSCWSLDRAQIITLGQDNMLRLWDGLLEDDYIESQMHSQEANFCESKSINALIMTWNAGASTPFALQQQDQDAVFFRDLIRNSGCPEILVFGFQELVDLEDKKTVTKSFFKSKKKDSSVQERMSHQYRDWRDFLTRCLDDYMPRDELYHLLHTSSLVGLFTCIFVKAPLIERIRCLSSAEIKRGLGGLHGNKGALIIRFVVDDTSMCFVNCHLAAGQTGTKDRNADITAILESHILPSETDHSMRLDSYIGGGDGTMILDHEICIVNGDLNYRIDTMSRDSVINAIKSKNISKLLERDQLLASKRKNPWFILRAFQELPITFAPTYKYDVGTDTYDTSEKKRSPAWCDRILYRGGDCLEQLDYRRHEVRVSDHRPVTGTFQIAVKRVVPKKRAIMWDEVQKQQLQRKMRLVKEAMEDYLINIIGYDVSTTHEMIQKHGSR